MARLAARSALGSAGTDKGQLLWAGDWYHTLPFQCSPHRRCGTLRKPCPRAGCQLGAAGGTVSSACHCSDGHGEAVETNREQKGLCVAHKYLYK